MDKFYEQFITKDYGNLPTILNVLSTIFLVTGIISFMLFGIFGLVFLVISLIVQVISRRTIVEYDYEYFEGSVTIARIMKKNKRKVIATFNVDNILKVYKKENCPNEVKIVNATVKDTGLLELILVINGKNNEQVGYLLSVDEKLHNILKRGNMGLFGF